jgi:cation transport ATPase
MQNLIFASAVIVILICASLGFSLALPIGVVGHEGSTVLVCLNGLRLLLIGHAGMKPAHPGWLIRTWRGIAAT